VVFAAVKNSVTRMPGNVEFKGKIDDIEGAKQKAEKIASEHLELEQDDVFFASPKNIRLKLRKEKDLITGKNKACLIAYKRDDVTGPKFSHYEITPVEDPVSLETVLKMSNGVLGKVEKKRDVYIVKRESLSARVHLDVVKGLRDYLEFEVIVPEGAKLLEVHAFADYLMEYFGVSEKDALPGAYFDLIPKEPEGDLEQSRDRPRKRKLDDGQKQTDVQKKDEDFEVVVLD